MTGLRPLRGHEPARAALASAARRGELPGAILLHGPPGVGKQRLGLWLAQLLACHHPDPLGPCEQCAACRLARRLEHPDIEWFFPLPRPRTSGGPDRLAEALEEARAAELAARRADPFWVRAPGQPAGIFLAQIQTLRRRAAARPALGPHKTFLIGDAEELVPQEASPEAANALLKLLEEPPPHTTIILTAADPNALLPTLRSRLAAIALRPLPDATVEAFLLEERGAEPAHARLATRLAQGSIGRALGLLPTPDGPGPLETLRARARQLLEAATDPAPLARLAAAHATPTTGARGEFLEILDFLALWIRDLAATATGARELVINTDARPLLDRLARRLPTAAATAPEAIRAIEQARATATINANPQLTTAVLLRTLHQTLTATPAWQPAPPGLS